MTGSCSFHTCTRYLPIDFSEISEKVFDRYKKALQVELLDAGESRKELVVKKRMLGEKRKILQSKEMGYLLKSRDFCDPDSKNNLSGTKNRVCGHKFIGNLKTSSLVNVKEINVCGRLCCGRGYITTRKNINVGLCKCKFYMDIMDVKCKTCNATKELYLCR